MKKILITGGAGFIGSHLAKKLKDSGYEVTILDVLSKQIHGKCNNVISNFSDFNFIVGSVLSKRDLKRAIKNQEAIIHLAAETGTGQSMYQIHKYSETNIQGTALLLDIIANSKNKIKKIIVASSRAVYGEGKYWSEKYRQYVYPKSRFATDMLNGNFNVSYLDDFNIKHVPTDELSLMNPTSLYGITKQVQEQLIMSICPNLNIAPVSLRFQNVYGPGQSLLNPYTGIVSIFASLIMSGEKLNIFEDGKESRDFIFIDDVINAIKISLESQKANNEIFNVGTGVSIDVYTVAVLLKSILQKEVEINVSGNFRVGDIRHNYADISKIRNLLDFSPSITFEQGLSLFCDWVKNQEVGNNYSQSLSYMRKKNIFK